MTQVNSSRCSVLETLRRTASTPAAPQNGIRLRQACVRWIDDFHSPISSSWRSDSQRFSRVPGRTARWVHLLDAITPDRASHLLFGGFPLIFSADTPADPGR